MSLTYFESELRLPGGMVVLPLRSTLIKTSRAIILISPIDFSAEQLEKIDKVGKVTDIVAPSLIHHLFIPKAIERFKSAIVWGPPGCNEKLPDIPWRFVFTKDDWYHQDEVKALFIAGMPSMNEVVFLDKNSKTLIVTDLCFNLQHPKGWAAPVMLRLLGSYKKFAVSRLLDRYMKDRQAFQESLHKLLEWNFEKIAMGHGDLITEDGKEKLIAALKEKKHLP